MSGERENAAILLVEDPFVRNFVRTVLERNGFAVVEAKPYRALRALADDAESVRLVITNAPDLFHPHRDRLRILYISGCPDPDIAGHFRCCRMLRKPFRPGELLTAVNELLASAL